MESASSAVGANILFRALFAGAFQLFGMHPPHIEAYVADSIRPAQRLYAGLGITWANSTLAFVAVAFIPIPILLLKLGPRIRRAGSLNTEIGFSDKTRRETLQRE